MSSSSMKCIMSSKETVFLKFWPQFDVGSSSGRKIERIASFVGSYGETWVLLSIHIASCKEKSYSISTILSTEF